MAGSIRPNKKAMELLFTLMKTPKKRQQKTEPNPREHLVKAWWIDSSLSQ